MLPGWCDIGSCSSFTNTSLCNLCVWEGARDRTELQYCDLHSYGRQRCDFLFFQGCSTEGPGAQSAGFLYYILSATSLDSNWSGPLGPPPPGFLYHILSFNSSKLQLIWLLVLTELYNSSTPTQSPTQSLEWHVWSSSSGNNYHAVQRSLSSGASVYECTMRFFFTLSHFISQIPLTWFVSITGHWDVSLPSGASLWNGINARVEGQNTTATHKQSY